jgi:hypothetical protein
MRSRKLKYQEFLSDFPHCPPDDYTEVEMEAFRWVHSSDHENDFTPINLINEPPARLLDDDDNMCKGYGLSLFDSLENANARYKVLYYKKREHLRSIFVADVGECIAFLTLSQSEGLANEPKAQNHGHFTFHEYENVELMVKVQSKINIFDTDGNFNN